MIINITIGRIMFVMLSIISFFQIQAECIFCEETEIGIVNVKSLKGKEIGMIEVSPDKKTALFDVRNKDYPGENLYIAKLDGSEPERLTKNSVEEGKLKYVNKYYSWPRFTSDSNKIVYVVHGLTLGYGLGQIWIMDIDGKNKKALTPNDGIICTDVEISPQGNKVLFNAYYRKERTDYLEVIDIDGNNRKKLFKNVG